MDKELEKLKAEYQSIPIPKELDEVVNQALRTRPQSKKRKIYWNVSLITAAAAIMLTIALNVSPVLASTLSEVPVIGQLVKIITFHEIQKTENNSSIEIKTPAIEGLNDTTLENSLNTKYMEESKQLYQEFEESMAALKEGQNGYLAVYSGYEVLTDNDRILSIRRYIENIQASGSIENHFDTIDKENEVLITLKSLFKDDSYIEVISEEIKKQMKQQMEKDSSKYYFLQEGDSGKFEQIKENQNFYINSENHLVIAFDDYEVAPGYMGAVEFVIPTDVISTILVGDRYIH